jgi:hypothetical protein
MEWKKGRGKLGVFQPLIGTWRAETDTDMGKIVCQRQFTLVLEGAYVQLDAVWQVGAGTYQERALFGVNAQGEVNFWSFTSDKKQSQGRLADVTDIDPQAIGFEAEMPAGLARQAYWPDGEDGFFWVVESRTKKGWNRFTQHHYQPA